MARRKMNGWYHYNATVAEEQRPDPADELRTARRAFYAARRHPEGLPTFWNAVLQQWQPIPAAYLTPAA